MKTMKSLALLIIVAIGSPGCNKSSEQEFETQSGLSDWRGLESDVESAPPELDDETRERLLAELNQSVGSQNLDADETECRDDCDASVGRETGSPYQGDVRLNYGNTAYGEPTYRYRGEVERDGYVRVRNLNGDTLRGYVERDGSVRLRNYDGDTYRGQVDSDGSVKLRDYDGSTLSGQIDRR